MNSSPRALPEFSPVSIFSEYHSGATCLQEEMLRPPSRQVGFVEDFAPGILSLKLVCPQARWDINFAHLNVFFKGTVPQKAITKP